MFISFSKTIIPNSIKCNFVKDWLLLENLAYIRSSQDSAITCATANILDVLTCIHSGAICAII